MFVLRHVSQKVIGCPCYMILSCILFKKHQWN